MWRLRRCLVHGICFEYRIDALVDRTRKQCKCRLQTPKLYIQILFFLNEYCTSKICMKNAFETPYLEWVAWLNKHEEWFVLVLIVHFGFSAKFRTNYFIKLSDYIVYLHYPYYTEYNRRNTQMFKSRSLFGKRAVFWEQWGWQVLKFKIRVTQRVCMR